MTNSESIGTFKAQSPTPRRSSRVFPDSLLVVRFPSGNHGLVLDISPAGVGFLAGAPLEEDEPVRFTISGKSALMTEAAGELIWRDSSGKRAGVRFTHISEGLRTLIRQSAAPESKLSRSPETIATRTPELLVRANEVIAPPRLAQRKFGVAANAMAAAFAFVMAVAIWYPLDRNGLRGSLRGLERGASALLLSARSYHLKFADEHPPRAIEATPVVFESHASAAARVLTQSEKAHAPAPATTRRGRGKTFRVRRVRNSGGSEKHATESPELLWQAVEKGSSAAEIELADRYLQAKGVAKNCSQAKVLLAAAQRHNNADAVRKLADLGSYDCE